MFSPFSDKKRLSSHYKNVIKVSFFSYKDRLDKRDDDPNIIEVSMRLLPLIAIHFKRCYFFSQTKWYNQNMKLKIEWLGHSCFRVTHKEYTIVFDPYKDDSVDGLPPMATTANQVICSHEHDDHYGKEKVQLVSTKNTPWKVTSISSYHDQQEGKKRGKNTITILEDGSLKIIHFGDIGCTIDDPRLHHADIVFVPIGGYYTLEPHEIKELVNQIQPKVVVVMHYRSSTFGYPEIQNKDVYLELCDDVHIVDTNTFEYDDQTQPQTLVLQLGETV